MWLLTDPLRLSERQLIVPQDLAPLLLFCDGTHTPDEIHTAFCEYVGGEVDRDIVTNALAQFDEALLLDNGRFQQAQQALLDEYRAQPHRPPALADLSYPGDAVELTRLFHEYGAGDNLNDWQPWHGRGIISPHIDYHRGGTVYAKVWRRAETAVREALAYLVEAHA